MIVTKHGKDVKDLADTMSLLDSLFQEAEGEARQEFEGFCEEIKNKNMEELNMLKLTLNGQIEELERHFESVRPAPSCFVTCAGASKLRDVDGDSDGAVQSVAAEGPTCGAADRRADEEADAAAGVAEPVEGKDWREQQRV
jgi:hypothetical protein